MTVEASADRTAEADTPATSRWRDDRGFLYAVMALAALSVIVRVPFMAVPMINDEGGYAYIARLWAETDASLYRDLPYSRPQGIFVIYRAMMGLGAETVVGFRFLAGVYNVLTLVILMAFARAAFGRQAAVVTGVLFAVFSTAPSIEGFTANAEIFVLLPAVGCAWACYRDKYLLAGVLAALAILAKPSGIEAVALVAIWTVYNRLRAPAAWGQWWRDAALGTFGFVLGLLPSLIHGAVVGWSSYWKVLVNERTTTFTAETTAPAAQFARFVTSIGTVWPALFLLVIGAILGAVILEARRRNFLLVWTAAAFVGMAIGIWWDWHFYLQIVPPLAALAGAGLASAWNQRRRLLVVAVAVGGAIPFIAVDGPRFVQGPLEISYGLYGRPGYIVNESLAASLDASMAKDDLLFVAFSQAELYYLARRKAAVPTLLWAASAMYSKRDFDAAISALTEKRPAVVVVERIPPPQRMSREAFYALLDQGYELVDSPAPGVDVYRRRGR